MVELLTIELVRFFNALVEEEGRDH